MRRSRNRVALAAVFLAAGALAGPPGTAQAVRATPAPVRVTFTNLSAAFCANATMALARHRLVTSLDLWRTDVQHDLGFAILTVDLRETADYLATPCTYPVIVTVMAHVSKRFLSMNAAKLQRVAWWIADLGTALPTSNDALATDVTLVDPIGRLVAYQEQTSEPGEYEVDIETSPSPSVTPWNAMDQVVFTADYTADEAQLTAAFDAVGVKLYRHLHARG